MTGLPQALDYAATGSADNMLTVYLLKTCWMQSS
jgi:hypothetical protein